VAHSIVAGLIPLLAVFLLVSEVLAVINGT
jgi:hypothetical protein